MRKRGNCRKYWRLLLLHHIKKETKRLLLPNASAKRIARYMVRSSWRLLLMVQWKEEKFLLSQINNGTNSLYFQQRIYRCSANVFSNEFRNSKKNH